MLIFKSASKDYTILGCVVGDFFGESFSYSQGKEMDILISSYSTSEEVKKENSLRHVGCWKGSSDVCGQNVFARDSPAACCYLAFVFVTNSGLQGIPFSGVTSPHPM